MLEAQVQEHGIDVNVPTVKICTIFLIVVEVIITDQGKFTTNRRTQNENLCFMIPYSIPSYTAPIEFQDWRENIILKREVYVLACSVAE